MTSRGTWLPSGPRSGRSLPRRIRPSAARAPMHGSVPPTRDTRPVTPRRRLRALAAAGALVACAALSACGGTWEIHASGGTGGASDRPAVVPASPTSSQTPPPSPSASRASEEPAVVTPSPDVSAPTSAPGLVPVVHRIETRDPVVFITIDDGYEKDPAVVALLRARHVPVTAFLAVTALQSNHDYFSEVQKATGQSVQDHTLTHPFLSRLSYDRQRHEICGAADQLTTWYGARPWLFRPPYGDYSATTRRAAKDCGMTAIVLWDVSLPHRVLRYASGSSFHAGDILLVHWRPNLARDLPVALDAIQRAGLRVAALQDYLPRPS